MNDFPYQYVLITDVSWCAKKFELIERILVKSGVLSDVKFAQWRRRWMVHVILLQQQHEKDPLESWKICLSLCSFKWLRPRLRSVRSFIPNGFCNLKGLFYLCARKLNISFSKDSKVVESQMFKNNFWINYV